MIRKLAAVAASFLIAAAAAAQVPLAELEALYGAAYPGTGIRSTAIVPDAPCAAGQVLTVNSAGTGVVCTTAASGGRTDAEIDARIAPYARATPSGQIADAQIQATITRDTEIQDSCVDLTYVGSTLSCVQRDGTNEQVTITTTGTTDGVVTGGSVSGTDLTLTRSQGLADVTITGLPSGGAADGVVTGGSVAGTTLRLDRSIGGQVSISGLPDDTVRTISTATPEDVAATGSAGSGTQVSAANHVHGGFTDTNTQLTQEQVEDFVGATAIGGTQTGITVTYADNGAGAGFLNFVATGGGGGQPDGVVTGGSVSDTTLTLHRSLGGDVTITGLPEGATDAEITALIRDIVIFHAGNGPPAAAPSEGGLVALDREGRLYGAIAETVTHTTDPAITTSNVPTNSTGAQLGSWWQGYDAAASGTQGHFTYNHYVGAFQQIQGTSTHQPLSWHQVLSYIASSGQPSADRIDWAATAIYLGHFGSDDAAADAMSRNGTAVNRYSGGAPAVASRAYFINSGDRHLKRVDTFAAGTSTVTNVLQWRDAPLTHVDLRNYVKEFARTGERLITDSDLGDSAVTVRVLTPEVEERLVPAGGGNLEVLRKTSSADYATAWATILSAATPQEVGGTPTSGGSNFASPDNHVHGIGDSTIVEADLSAIVRQRLQQPGGTTGQVWTKDSGTNYDASWQTFSAGTTTFIADTDTPSTYTGQARRVVRVNAGESAVEFVDETPPSHAFPNVGRLPVFSETSPNIVYLTDSYGEGGRVDATMTLGNNPGDTLTGYSDGTDLDDAFGSIDRVSPLAALYGGISGATYHIQSVASLNENWINEFTHILIGTTEYTLLPTVLDQGVWNRRIQNYPDNLSAATLAINFRRSDGTYYFTNNVQGTFLAGLWEKFDGRYSRLTSKGLVHIDGVGEPTTLPTAAAQSYVDDLGRTWISGDMIIHPLSPPMITQSNDLSNPFFLPGRTVFELEANGIPNGSFTYWLNNFWHRIDTGNAIHGTWNSLWSYIVREVPDWTNIGRLSASMTTATNQIFLTGPAGETVAVGDFLRINSVEPYEIVEVTGVTDQATFTVSRAANGTTAQTWGLEVQVQIALGNPLGDTAATRRFLHDGVFIGHFASEALAAEERSLYTDATKNYYFSAPPTESVPREIISYTGPTMTLAEDHYFWNGPLITADDALDIIEEVIIPNPAFADPTTDLYKIYIDGITYDTESVIHPNRVTGDLRLAVASDWDVACNCSRNIAWDGEKFLSAHRDLIGAHSADATFTQMQEGATFTVGGRTYRYRGSHQSSTQIGNQQLYDFFYDRANLELSVCGVYYSGSGCLWGTTATSGLAGVLQEHINYVGYTDTFEHALAFVNADGQRIAFNRLPWQATGEVTFTGAPDTVIPLGTQVQTTGNIVFQTFEEGTISADGNVMLDVRAVVGGSNGNIAANTVLTLVNAITGVAAVAPAGAFTGGDDTNTGRQLFTVSNYQAPNPFHYTYVWRPLEGFEEGMIAFIGPDETTGDLRDAHATDYNELTGRSKVVGFDGESLYKVGRRLVTGHTASATLTRIDDLTQLGIYRWRDVHWQDYLVTSGGRPAPAANDLYWKINVGFRLYDGAHWHDIVLTELNDRVFLGAFPSEAEALAHLSGDNQYVVSRDSGGGTDLRLSSNFNPGLDAHYAYQWNPVFTFDGAAPGSEFSTGGVQLLRDFGRVEPGDVQWPLGHGFNGESWGFWASGTDNFGSRPRTWPSSIIGFYYSDGTTFQEEDTWILWVAEPTGSGNRHYDDVKIRIAGNEHTFSYNRRSANDLWNGYIADSFTATSYTDGQTVPINIEDIDGEIPYNLPGTPWESPVDPFVGSFTPGQGVVSGLSAADVEDFALVAETAANMPIGRLATDVVARLLPAIPSDDQIARYDSASSAWVAEDLPGGGGGGLTEAQVDARVVAGTLEQARAGNTDQWPTGKLGSGTADATTFLRGDGDWVLLNLFEVADEQKLDGIAAGAEVNVQADWNETDTASDAFILNKPSSLGGGSGVPFVMNANVTYSDVGGRRRVNLADSSLDNDEGTMVMFQYADDDFDPATQEVELGINGSDYVRWKILDENEAQKNVTLGDISRYTIYFLYRAGSFWHVVGQTQHEFVTDGRIDGRVATWARAVSPSGTAPVARLGTGSPGTTTFLRGDGVWSPPPSQRTLSSSTPDSVGAQAGGAGSSTQVSRGSHRHQVQTDNATPQTVGTAAGGAGNTDALARANHAHGLTTAVQGRLLPASPSDNEIAVYDTATTSWAAEGYNPLPDSVGGAFLYGTPLGWSAQMFENILNSTHLYEGLTNALVAGTGVTLTEDDTAHTITVSSGLVHTSLHDSTNITEDQDDWNEFTLSQAPADGGVMELELHGAFGITIFEMSSDVWLDLTAIAQTQVTDSDDSDGISGTSAIRFLGMQSAGTIGSNVTYVPCVIGRRIDTALLIGCQGTGIFSARVVIAETR